MQFHEMKNTGQEIGGRIIQLGNVIRLLEKGLELFMK
jgi:hypothetical protein